MSLTLISAAMTSAIVADSGVPSEIVYLPEGEHNITPTVNGKAQRIMVRVPADKGADIAAKLQAALAIRQKQNVRPWFDFEHKSGKASAIPTAFRYEEGKGVMASIEWTGAGKAAIEGKDFSYLSPTFLIDDSGLPSGLPARGPLAALVNEPAFREIPRIAASDTFSKVTDHSKTMSNLILASLAINPAADNAEADAIKSIEVLKVQAADASRLTKENAALAAKVEAAEAVVVELRKNRAADIIKAAVNDGRILPKDTELQDKFRAKIEAGDTFAEDILAGMAKIHDGLEKPIVLGTPSKEVKAADKFDGKTGVDLLEAALAEEFSAMS